MSAVAVIIVNWNSWAVLARCLRALAMQTSRDFSITVIDNCSQEIMPDNLPAEYPNVRIVKNPSNMGFAAANNRAVQLYSGDSEWIALLNPDAFPEPDWLAQLLLAAEQHPDCAVFASRQINATDPTRLDGDGDVYHISGRVWRGGWGQKVPQHSPAVRPVFSPCAAAAMYRREVFNKAGGFDEDFFCYLEDVDLGFRLQLTGHPCLLVTAAIVHHLGSVSAGGQHSDFATYYGHRNLTWCFVKNMPGALFWWLLPIHLGMNLIGFCVLAFRGQGAIFLKAKRDALSGTPAMWRKRAQVQAMRTVSSRNIWRMLDKTIWTH